MTYKRIIGISLLVGLGLLNASPSVLEITSFPRQVTSLFEENGIRYDFDSNSERKLRFEVQQSIEGYYYCSRNMSAGLPDDYKTILAHPRRVNIQTHFIRQVGEPVILRNGVGEGALGEHYCPRWFKDGLPLTNANVSRGNDFSLHIEAVKLSDAGAYVSSVTISNGNVNEYTIQENDRPIRLTVFESPVIEQVPQSIVMDEQENKIVSFNCIVNGAPSLRVSWFKGTKNLTFGNPSRYSINESRMNSTRVTSTLTILHPTYEDSGRYACVSTILNDETGEEKFRAQENATLTVLESDFALRTAVTEHQQLQLWVELHIPLFDAVTAVVYFTLKEEQNTKQHVTTHSVLTENTVMVFQLESHEIPEKFQHEDFLVQVALQVGTKEGSVVPSNLEAASTSNLDQPTEDCSRDVTYRIAVVSISSIIGLVVVMIAVIAVAFCLYKMYKARQRTKRLANLPVEERKRLQNDLKEYQKDLIAVLGNPSLNEAGRREIVEQIKKNLTATRGQLGEDGFGSDEENK